LLTVDFAIAVLDDVVPACLQSQIVNRVDQQRIKNHQSRIRNAR
jgi:hypothetical protein